MPSKDSVRASTRRYGHFKAPANSKVALAFPLLFLFTVSTLASPVNYPGLPKSSGASASSATLVLSARPPVLPADGGTYVSLILQFKNLTSGVPIIPQSNVTVSLASSNPVTGSVPSIFVYPANRLFTEVDFKTTSTPGTTTITAFAQGFAPATINVQTRTVGGMPTSLQVIVAPSSIPPERTFNTSVIVQAFDVLGNPVRLASNLSVTLSTSNAQIGVLPSSLVIPAGKSFASATFTPSYVAGETVITAFAPGFSSGKSTLSTIGPVPRRLVLSASPDLIAADGVDTALLSIQLQDNNSQTPALAPTDVSVVVTSDNAGVISVPSPFATIPQGQSYAIVVIKSGGASGQANITVSAQGYLKGSTIVYAKPAKTIYPGCGSSCQLAEYFAPSTLLPNNMTYTNAISVELQYSDSSGTYPARAGSPFTIFTRSSNNATMQVSTANSTVQTGLTHTYVDISSTFLPGTASISAQSVGISSYTASLLAFGPDPNELKLEFAPSFLISDGGTYNSVVVSMVDSTTGAPAKAPLPTLVNLAIDSTSAGNIEDSAVIPAGQTFALASFSTSGLPGTVQVTASASNYTAASGTLNLVSGTGKRIALYAIPSSIVADGGTYPSLVVQVQDSSGNPEKTDFPLTIQLASPSGLFASVPTSVPVQPDSTFSMINVNSTTRAGSTNVTAYAVGFTSASTVINTILIPLSGQITSLPSVNSGSTFNVSLVSQSGGMPLGNVSVKWIANGAKANLLVSRNSTANTGFASARYKASGDSGWFLVQALLTKPGYSSYIATANITLVNTGGNVLTNTKVASVSLWIWIVIIGAVVAGSVLVYYFFVRRERFRRREEAPQIDFVIE